MCMWLLFRVFYVSWENQTFFDVEETYDKYLPGLVPDGTPCTVGEDKNPGVSKDQKL